MAQRTVFVFLSAELIKFSVTLRGEDKHRHARRELVQQTIFVLSSIFKRLNRSRKIALSGMELAAFYALHGEFMRNKKCCSPSNSEFEKTFSELVNGAQHPLEWMLPRHDELIPLLRLPRFKCRVIVKSVMRYQGRTRRSNSA